MYFIIFLSTCLQFVDNFLFRLYTHHSLFLIRLWCQFYFKGAFNCTHTCNEVSNGNECRSLKFFLVFFLTCLPNDHRQLVALYLFFFCNYKIRSKIVIKVWKLEGSTSNVWLASLFLIIIKTYDFQASWFDIFVKIKDLKTCRSIENKNFAWKKRKKNVDWSSLFAHSMMIFILKRIL